jgi:hypothetical protein
VRTWLSEPEGMLALEEVPFAMGVHGGAVEFEGLTLPRGVGRLQLDGSLSLAEGLTEITLRTDTAGGELEAHLIGQPGDLVPAPKAPPSPALPLVPEPVERSSEPRAPN